MTSVAVRLEDFGSIENGFTPAAIDGSRLEAERLAAFDKGYAAGWDDAVAAAEQEREASEAELRGRLLDLGFTFHEARTHVMLSMTPLLKAIVSQALPRLLSETLGARIVEELEGLAAGLGDAPVELLVPEGDAGLVETALQDHTAFPVEIREEETLTSGQLYLRLGASEREIDLTALGTRIDDALAALDNLNKAALTHD